MLKDQVYFISAIGTDIGKTYLLTQIGQILNMKSIPFSAIKPIASGFSDNDLNSDSAKILQVQNLALNLENLNKITPYRFAAPIAPSLAAKEQNQEIDLKELIKFCQDKIAKAKIESKILFIEGAGGLMTPINDHYTYLDLIKALNVKVLLVSSNYLGAISHTLCALKLLQLNAIKVEKVIVNDYPKSNLQLTNTIDQIALHSNLDVVAMENFLQDLKN